MPKKSTEDFDVAEELPEPDEPDDVAKLLELKRKYKADCDALETELIMRHQHEEAERKAGITADYLEKLSVLFVERIKPLLMEVLKD